MISGITFVLTLEDVLFCLGSVFLTLILVSLALWARGKFEVTKRW